MNDYLDITVPERELFDNATNTFYTVGAQKLRLLHSLISLSRWESKWKVSFLNTKDKTQEQTLDYVRAMTVNQPVDPGCYSALTPVELNAISEYINDPMTATVIYDDKNKLQTREVFTAEVIYYWMIALNIPKDFEKWHLNRLLTLISVCNLKSQPKKKLSPQAAREKALRLNAERKALLGTRG